MVNDQSHVGVRRLPVTVIGLAWLYPVALCHAQITFVDRTVDAGLQALHQPVEAGIPGLQEWMTGGMAVADFNNDGWQDIFWTSGGTIPDKLFINNGNGTFNDKAAAWGLTDLHCGNGVAVGDFNSDGWMDIFVTSFGDAATTGVPGQHRLYRNSGSGTFTEVAASAGVNFTTTQIATAYGAAFGDYDMDGHLDLCVVSWWGLEADGVRLFHNNGDETFTDVTDTALGTTLGIWGFQPAFVDMDGDLYPELLISADFESSRYFVNNGDGTFTDQSILSGTGLDDNGMGQTIADFNNDGLLDWYVTSIHKDMPKPGDNVGNMLYIAQGAHVFNEVSVAAGVNNGGWGWGTVAADLDHDTWIDIIEVNGRPGGTKADPGEWQYEPAKVFHNQSGLQFFEIALQSGFNHAGEGRAIVRFDAENDGDQDFIVCTNAGNLTYFENQTLNSGNWLRVLLDTSNNPLLAPNGFGAIVETIVSGQTYIRCIDSAPSYLATGEISAHFGLAGAATIDEIRVKWPRGYVTTLIHELSNQTLTISSPTPTDLNGDGITDVGDLLLLLGKWGPVTSGADLLSDLDNDGQTEVNDLLTLLAGWN